MQFKAYLKTLYEYNFWADHRYFAVAEGLTDDQLHRLQGHSWGDVHAMFVHLVSSEWIWLQRWNGTSPKSHLDKAEFPTLASIKERWSAQEDELFAFIRSRSEASLQTVITYNNLSGETFHVPLWQMLVHLANHETHHRGELAAMFALMNVPHPEDEVIQFFLDQSGQKKFS
jgi:uncharacterized damage-inducible protein DinB